jgi:uncharacterized membrane protein YoaK (UPF0700 family)
MRCETCHRPWLTKQQHQNLWGWLIFPILILAVFFAGAVVEAVAQFDVIQAAMWVAGYAVATGVIMLWWQIKVKD